MNAPMSPPVILFTPDDLERAWRDWGCNCGPAALAVATGRHVNDVRLHLPGFDARRYTNPTMMALALGALGVPYHWHRSAELPIEWPRCGLARIQWEGPWTAPGIPIPARYRHSHWVAVFTIPAFANPDRPSGRGIFDVNCPYWVPFESWRDVLVPEILKDWEPKATGQWWVTDAIEVTR